VIEFKDQGRLNQNDHGHRATYFTSAVDRHMLEWMDSNELDNSPTSAVAKKCFLSVEQNCGT